MGGTRLIVREREGGKNSYFASIIDSIYFPKKGLFHAVIPLQMHIFLWVSNILQDIKHKTQALLNSYKNNKGPGKLKKAENRIMQTSCVCSVVLAKGAAKAIQILSLT